MKVLAVDAAVAEAKKQGADDRAVAMRSIATG